MAYRMIYLRVHTNGYVSGWSNESDKAAFNEESRRLCDRDRRNTVGNRFVSELIDQLLQEGRLVSAETACGAGIRTATERELKNHHQHVEQVDGQITIMF